MWMMSGPLCDWMDAVMRGCRSLALMNSNCTSAPSSREASPACFFSSTSQAGMKSTQRRTCSLLPCANAGARPAAVSPTTAPLPCKNRRRVMPARMVMALALVDLLELGLGPLHGVLGPHALHGLGVHVDDDVLRVRLGGLRRRRSLVAEHPRLARGAPEDLQRLVDLGPHRMLFPGLRGAHRIALVHLEPLPVVLLLVHPGQEALGELWVLAVLHHRVLEGHVERGLAGRPRRQRRRVLDVLPERLALLVLDLVLLTLGDDVDRRAVEGGADLARVEGAVVVRVVPGQPALVAGVLPERCEKFHRLHRALGIEDDTLAGGIRLGAPVAPQARVREGRRIAEAVSQRLADGPALGLELSACLAPGVHRRGEFGEADLRVPRAAPGHRVAAGAVRP